MKIFKRSKKKNSFQTKVCRWRWCSWKMRGKCVSVSDRVRVRERECVCVWERERESGKAQEIREKQPVSSWVPFFLGERSRGSFFSQSVSPSAPRRKKLSNFGGFFSPCLTLSWEQSRLKLLTLISVRTSLPLASTRWVQCTLLSHLCPLD